MVVQTLYSIYRTMRNHFFNFNNEIVCSYVEIRAESAIIMFGRRNNQFNESNHNEQIKKHQIEIASTNSTHSLLIRVIRLHFYFYISLDRIVVLIENNVLRSALY